MSNYLSARAGYHNHHCHCQCHQPCPCYHDDPSSITFRRPIVITIPSAPLGRQYCSPHTCSDTSNRPTRLHSLPDTCVNSVSNAQLEHYNDRRVHFDLLRPERSRHHRCLTYQSDGTFSPPRQRAIPYITPYPPSPPGNRQHQTRSILRNLPVPQTQPPSTPTIYIITYAKSLAPSPPHISYLLSTQIPIRTPPIPHISTLDVSSLPVPPAKLCDMYSGISPTMQDIVCSYPQAQRWVKRAVKTLLDFGMEQDGNAKRQEKGQGHVRREVSMTVCCESGTHRSVAIAERIAQGVKEEVARMGGGDGVRIVCRHVHRVKGIGDPF